jgi:outer membrane protein insertion porin family
MNSKKKIIIFIISILLCNISKSIKISSPLSYGNNFSTKNIKNYTTPSHPNLPTIFKEKNIKIENIIIKGLCNIPLEAILSKLPIKSGDSLNAKKISKIVKNIYGLGYFTDVKLYYEKLESNNINLHINVIEKKKVAKFLFNGNEYISEETIEKQINHSKIHWIDIPTISVIIEKLKQFYKEKQYNSIDITYILETMDNGSVNVVFKINEGVFYKIKTITFKGNNLISKFELKSILASRESWLLGFLDRGGIYRKEMIDFDRYQIENYYQSKGFYQAHVLEVSLQENENTGMMDIVFFINEGEIFYFNNINIENNSELKDSKLKRIININKNDIYNKEKIKFIIQLIRYELGELGYMYPQIYPKMKINKENNTIDVSFIIEKGKPIYVRNINIKGNTKTYENIIRREIIFNEGELLTAKKLEESKRAVEGLGFFQQQNGVSWELETFDKYQANINLLLQEAKTGRFYINMAINSGSDAGKNEQSLNIDQGSRWYDTLLTVSRIGLTVQDSNWNGKGIRYFVDLSYANLDRSLTCGMSTPWFFDYPISAGWNASFRNLIYNQFQQTTETPNEKNQGINFQFGYRCSPLSMTLFGLSIGMDNINYVNPIIPLFKFPDNPIYQMSYNQIVSRSFQPGTITWINLAISNDKRNHPTRASVGHKWILEAKIALPNQTLFKNISNFGYTRIGAELDWFTPLIIDYDVILHLHGYAGYIYKMFDCNIPYKELFHIGGPQNVRGFLYGQIGPMLMGSSLGATKTFFINAEIRCPITQFNGMMVLVFYDGGAGWDTIYNDTTNNNNTNNNNYIESNIENYFFYNPDEILIQNNSFQYRHSVGFGIRLTQPMPIKIDWGFKLDRNKKLGESLSEVHIAMEGEY